jgi:UDP-N-acetylglucosamine 2-epimerase (non-hydrolysing)
VAAKRILTIAGTRPEAIKLAPLVHRLAAHPDIDHHLVATGQHGNGFHEALGWFGLTADHDLDLPNPGLDVFCEALALRVSDLIEQLVPDLVLVQGDTSSAWATALAAAACGIPIGHVEAGLRSGNPHLPWPEERNRIEIDALSTLLFAPSEAAAENLAGLPGAIHVTGNTGIDALMMIREQSPAMLHDSTPNLILVTCHRREAVPRLSDLAQALRRLARGENVRILLPVHGNPAIGAPLRALLDDVPHVDVAQGLPYPDLVRVMERAHLLLTDSGGLQEEAAALGLPALILRDNTERPEVIASGNAKLVGLDPAGIVREATRVLADPRAHAAMSHPVFPYGRGDAAERILSALESWLGVSRRLPLHAPAVSYASYS